MKKYLIAVLTFALPAVAFGQQLTNISILVTSATHILNQLVPFAIGLGLVVFLFGIIRYITAGAGEEKAAARNLMIYGIIALFVMVSVWGLVNFIGSSLGLNNPANEPAPNIPTNNSGGY
jgi:Type IV secretion system pilin